MTTRHSESWFVFRAPASVRKIQSCPDRIAWSNSAKVNDPVRMYLKEIGVVPLLTNEENRVAILVDWVIWSKQRLAEANLRLVVSIAKRYVGRGMQFWIWSRNMEMKAVDKFDYTKRVQVLYLCDLVDPSGHHPCYYQTSALYHSVPVHGWKQVTSWCVNNLSL